MSVRGRQRGVAAVELGLLLVPLTALVFGITEYGRAMYQYNAVAKAVRIGARFLSQYAAGDAARATQAQCLVVFGNTGCNGTAVVPGLTVGMVEVDDAFDTPALEKEFVTANGVTVGVTNLVRVRVQGYQFTPLVGVIGPFNFAPFVFDPISVTMSQAIP